MHRWLFLSLIAALVGTVAGCTEEDPAPLFMDIRYQVRCVDCEPRAPDDPVRDVELLDGEQGYTIMCRANTRDGDRLLTFSTTFINPDMESENFSISVLQVNLDDDDPGSDCSVQVKEGSNTYEGDCTSGDPTVEEPCSVDFSVDGDVVTGEIFCADVPNRNMAMTKRHLVAPGEEEEGAQFELHGCTGL
ncbi:MAG: hypothetical protein OXT09_07930 [Myxococcales bacterium]|nr:hypothetical protein [Myxococcales bacterium]